MNGTSMQRFKRIIFHFSEVPDITEQPLTRPQTQLKPVTDLDPLLIKLHGLNLMPESRSTKQRTTTIEQFKGLMRSIIKTKLKKKKEQKRT